MGLRVCQLCAVDFTLKHFLLPLIDGMQNRGWEVTAVCSDGPEIPGLRARGYVVDTIPISRSLNVFRHAVSVVRLAAYFRQQRFDILHVHTPVAALVARAGRPFANSAPSGPLTGWPLHAAGQLNDSRPVAGR